MKTIIGIVLLTTMFGCLKVDVETTLEPTKIFFLIEKKDEVHWGGVRYTITELKNVIRKEEIDIKEAIISTSLAEESTEIVELKEALISLGITNIEIR